MQGVNSATEVKTIPANPQWDTRFKSYAFADGTDDSLREEFCNAESLLMQSKIVKNSRSTAAGIFHLYNTDYFIKRSNADGLFRRLRRIGAVSRAKRNALMAAELEKIGVLTPKVYMALDTRPYGLPGSCYLITGCYPAPITVGGNLRALREFAGSNQELISRLAGLACKLHNHGIEHGDFKINNILAVRDSNGRFDLGVFDLDGSRKYSGSCPENVRARELARVASSYFMATYNLRYYEYTDEAENRRLFLQSYAQHGGGDLTENREFHRRMEKFLTADTKHRIRND
ncbi:MAG: hypothetical protein J6Q81_05265 [Lentisphaeria bacterium]|nr:hypothetical protein [Lentisphaeria bacterium]